MNRIYKVIYSKVRQCYVVVSEIAKSHGRHTKSSVAKSSAALTAGVLIALGSFSFEGMPVVQAADGTESLRNNDFVGANDYYWYYDEKEKDKDKKWKTYQYKATDIFNNRSRKDLPNYQGGGAKLPGAITAGLYAQAGMQTVTIGDRNAGQSKGSVFIGEHSGYNNGDNAPAGMKNNYVTSVGFQSDATGWGSIAIGSNAKAENSKMESQVVEEVGDAHTSGTVSDDTYGIKENPTIQGASVALGYSASAADGALAMGSNAQATNMATALGYGAHAADNNIAIGANSVATAASTAPAKFRDDTDSDYNAPSSYVSVGSSTLKRRITNVAAGADENDVATVGQLKKVADNKIAWKLTTAGDSNNASTVSAGDTVDFSAAKDSKSDGKAGDKDHSNLTISKENSTNKVNMTVGLSDNVVLGQNASGKGGSLDVYRAVGDASSNQLGSHVRIDGSTVSVRYDNGTDSNARGAVLGIANDSYQDTNDTTKTVSSPLGYVYLRDGGNYYYLHGAMHGDTNYQGRLAYDTESGSNYIANLDDGLKFTGDTENTTVETKLDPNAANNTLSIKGGVTDSGKLTSGNIGVVATANTTDEKGNVTSAGGLSIQLAKNLTGITSISSQITSATTTTGAKIELGTSGTTISGGDVNVSSNKITNLENGEADTDAATVGQMNTAIGNAKTKYYSVNDKNSISPTQETLPTMPGLADNSDNNKGAKGMGSLASGFSTEADGIASTVAGSYSGVINQNGNVLDLRGATALSYGTFNINQNTDTQKAYSGVANSIVGQANMTTDSNAAIIVGAGNSVTNSYRKLNEDALSAIQSAGSVSALKDALQAAVPKSGAQVMVMGGGNSVDKAYMTQVVGVGNKVTGSDDTYTEGTSTQYNYVDGFQNTLTNGKNDYIIGANNSVTGDSIDKNQSNIVVGDNHTLNNEKNNVVLGSADSSKELAASGAVVIGHNADVSVDNGVALGSDSVASVEEGQKGYDPAEKVTNKTTAPWTSTKAAVSVGKADGSVTRQITGGAAGTNDTDAVNVAQIKKLASVDASNIGKNFKDGDVTTNENAWGEALGTGTVTKDSKQLVTGGTVYNEVRPSKDGEYVKIAQTTGANLIALDDQVQTNTDTLSDVNSRSVKYDTKTENDKTVVDNTKITLAGDGGTTITNLKAGEVAKTSKDAVNGSQLYAEQKDRTDADTKLTSDLAAETQARTDADTAINNKLGTLDANGNYIKKDASVSSNLNTLDTQVKANADAVSQEKQDRETAITNVTNNLNSLTDSAVQYDKDSNKGTVTLAGEGGTTITNLKAGEVAETSKDAVNGSQLYAEQKARTDADTKLTSDLAAETQARTDADTAINNKLGTLDANGNYIKKDASISSNLNTLDTQVKANADAVSKEKQDRETAITNITNNIGNLSDSAVKYDADTNKTKVTLAGEGGTTITNLKDGALSDSSTDAVTGKQLYAEQKARTDADAKLTSDLSAETQAREAADKAINNKLGTLDANGNYIKKDASVSSNLSTLDTQVKTNADAISKEKQDREAAITNITNNIGNLSDSAVKYDADTNKTKVTLAGEGGTTITNVKDGALSENSTDAVNGKQLYNEQKAREEADKAITEKVTNNTNEITKIKNGNFTDASKTAIHNIAKAAVKVVDGKNTTVTEVDGTDTTPTTYAVNVEGTGKVDSGDTGLISGDTLYKEVHVDKDGSYIKGSQSVGQNLSALDTGLKTTSDLIHTNDKGDTIQIGADSKATKVDISGKDANGNKTGRVITGVVSDANDPNSAANVGYVNGITAASNEQIYRDMNMQYNHVENDISRAAAGSNALAALHPMQEFDPDDKAQFALGYGHYRNSNAGAVGAFYQPDENSLFSFGVSFGNGDAGLNAGVTFKFGPGGSDHHALTKTQMAKVIDAQSKEIDALKKDNADKDKRIDALEQKVNEILAKVEKDKA